ncbi:hypothetical protein ACMFMG_007581 [Clarireedia jacksonii]
MLCSFSNFAVTIATSAYAAHAKETRAEFHASQEVFELGFSLFVVGFAVGPLFWGPLSEVYGRQIIIVGTFIVFTGFNIGCAVAPNMAGLIIMRFLAGSFGASPWTNAGGVVADIWPIRQRGMAMVVLSAAPLFGPAMGPIVGGFISENCGWRWVEGFLAIFSGSLCILVALFVPETYGPLLLQRRAQELSKRSGKYYISKLDKDKHQSTLGKTLKVALTRPWLLLLHEPIVLVLSIYSALLYGTLYMFFGAVPIVFQDHRGWNEGNTGLAFIGLVVGILIGLLYMFPEHRRYQKIVDRGAETPESRLPCSIIGCIAIPIGIFWFAWTNSPNIHWAAPISGLAPFGFGFVLVFISVQQYFVDAYTIYTASALAANTMFRSGFGAVFPLFTDYMYKDLGDHWATSVPGFLAVACVPFPFLFYRYGEQIRSRCVFAKEASIAAHQLQQVGGRG